MKYKMTEEHKRKIGLANKGIPKSEEHKNNLSIKCKISMNNPEVKQKIIIATTGKKQSQETIAKRLKSRAYYRHSQESKQKMRLAKLGKIKSEEHRKKIKESRKSIIIPIKDTSIEKKIQNLLSELEIEYLTHKYMHIEHGYQCDIFIPSKNLVIECDGDFWHGNPLKNKELNEWQKAQRIEDDLRTKELREKGYTVIRLWESEIKSMTLENFKLIIGGK